MKKISQSLRYLRSTLRGASVSILHARIATAGFLCLLVSALCPKVTNAADDFITNVTQVPAPTTASRTTSAFSATTTLAAPVVHDVIVLYTNASVAAYTEANVRSKITTAIADANTAYANSVVGVTLRLLYMGPSPVQESGTGMVNTLTNFRSNAQVIALRNQYGADFAVLVSQDSDWCGYAYLWVNVLNNVRTVDAYAVNATSCLPRPTQVLAHEIGHLQGLTHDRASAGNSSPPTYPYGYGYRVCTSTGLRDIMSYACTNGTSPPMLVQFSNPRLSFNGQPTGIDYAVDPANAADASRALNDNAASVAAYKDAVSQTVPMPPTGLTVH